MTHQDLSRNSEIKKILAAKYGRTNVSIRQGRGTACGWVDIYIKVASPCPQLVKMACHACAKLTDGRCAGNNQPLESYSWHRSARALATKQVHEEARELLKGVHFDIFYSDDGYNTERDCVIIHIDFS